MAEKKVTCTKRIYPPGLAGIGSAHDCGNPSKGPNSEGEPRCGNHSDAAYARRDARRKAQEQAESERLKRSAAKHGCQIFITPEERVLLHELLVYENNRWYRAHPSPAFDKLIEKFKPIGD